MPPVEMVTGGEEKEPTDRNRNKTEVAASQLEIVHPDETVNKGNENEPADQDVAKPSKIGVATPELASDAVRKVSLTVEIFSPDGKVNKGDENEPADQDVTKPSNIGLPTSGLENEADKKVSVTHSLSSMQRQTQNEASFWSRPSSWLSSNILNTPMDKFNQLMTCGSTCLPLADAHSVIAAARDNQATEPYASVEEKFAAKDDELKLLLAKVEHQNRHNMTLSLRITKLELDIADFTGKVRELDQYAQTSYEAALAKEEVEMQRIAHTEEFPKKEAKLTSESQLVSKCEEAVRGKWKAKDQSGAHAEELRKMEAILTSTSQLVSELKTQMSQLKIENVFSLSNQKAYNEELQQEIVLAGAVNIANADELKTLMDGYFRESEIHNAPTVELKSKIFNATAKCEELAKLAQQTKKELEEKIEAQTAELDKMKADRKGKCKTTNLLSAGVTQLKKQIAMKGPIMDQEKSLGAEEGLTADQPEEAFVSSVNTMHKINRSEVFRAWLLSSSIGRHVGDTDNIITKTGNDDDYKMNTTCEMAEALSSEIANAKQLIPSAGSNKDQGEDDESLGPNEAHTGKQSDDSKDISIGRRKMVWLRKLPFPRDRTSTAALSPKRESQGTRESPARYISSCTRSSFDSNVEIQEESSSTSSSSKSCTKESPDIRQASLKQSKSVSTSDSTIESAGTSEASSNRFDSYSSDVTYSPIDWQEFFLKVQGEGRDDEKEKDSSDESDSLSPNGIILAL